jgi:hypothetical protein
MKKLLFRMILPAIAGASALNAQMIMTERETLKQYQGSENLAEATTPATEPGEGMVADTVVRRDSAGATFKVNVAKNPAAPAKKIPDTKQMPAVLNKENEH